MNEYKVSFLAFLKFSCNNTVEGSFEQEKKKYPEVSLKMIMETSTTKVHINSNNLTINLNLNT